MKSWICGLLSLLLILSIAACGNPDRPETDPRGAEEGETAPPAGLKFTGDADAEKVKNYREGVVNASCLAVKNGVAFWGHDQTLCSALLDGNRDLYDFISEGRLSSEIYGIALEDGYIYMATKDGLVRLSTKESEWEKQMLSVIDEHSLSNSTFQIYEDSIYFSYGYSLYKVPKEGGKSRELEDNIVTFQVTTEGIYCLNKKGDLICVSLDGKERRTLAELGSDGDIFILNDKAYITTGEDKDYIYVYDLGSGDCGKLRFAKDLSPYHPVWVTEDCIYYESDDYDIYRYDLKTEKETQSDARYDLPDYDRGYLEDAVIYYVYSDYLYWMHLDSGKSVKLGKEEALNYGASSASPEARNGQDDYDIAEDLGVYTSEGQSRLESRYFTLYLPSDGDWSYEVVDSRSINLYYAPAYQSGNGGLLVSIQAFDWGDNSYEDLPHYTVAGLSEDKKYIAVFPTDVQFDSKQAAGYNRMFEYVQRIDIREGKAENNPFSC